MNYIEARNNDGYQCQLKASFSQDLLNQLINIYFPKGSLIYDPFTGIAFKRVEEKRKEKDLQAGTLFRNEM